MDDIVLPPMPDAVDLPEVIRNYARAAVIADRERRTAQPEPDIGDYDIDKIADSMPGGIDGFLKHWGWRQFARAIIEADRKRRAGWRRSSDWTRALQGRRRASREGAQPLRPAPLPGGAASGKRSFLPPPRPASCPRPTSSAAVPRPSGSIEPPPASSSAPCTGFAPPTFSTEENDDLRVWA